VAGGMSGWWGLWFYDFNLPLVLPLFPLAASLRALFHNSFLKPLSAQRGDGSATEVRAAIDAGASQGIGDRQDETKD
jgi:hypothetical protein